MPTQNKVYLARTHAGGETLTRHRTSFFTHFPPSRTYDAATATSTVVTTPHCFRKVSVSNPMRATYGPSAVPAPFYRDMGARGARIGACRDGKGHTLLLQRRGHRRIVNEAKVAAALRKVFGLPVVVVELEGKTVPEQMALACGALIFVGVHGMGMEWAHFVNAGRGHGLVIELAWNGWPCHYTQRFRGTGKWAFCLIATPLAGGLPPPASEFKRGRVNVMKFVNVTLNVSLHASHSTRASARALCTLLGSRTLFALIARRALCVLQVSLIEQIDPASYVQSPTFRYHASRTRRLGWGNLSAPVRLASSAIRAAAAGHAMGAEDSLAEQPLPFAALGAPPSESRSFDRSQKF